MNLWRGEREYILRLNKFLREATQRCSAASDTWARRNDEFNGWYRRQFPDRMAQSNVNSEWVPVDPVHYANLKKSNMGLLDAESDWSHWQREVLRLAAAIQGQLHTHQLLEAPDWNMIAQREGERVAAE